MLEYLADSSDLSARVPSLLSSPSAALGRIASQCPWETVRTRNSESRASDRWYKSVGELCERLFAPGTAALPCCSARCPASSQFYSVADRGDRPAKSVVSTRPAS